MPFQMQSLVSTGFEAQIKAAVTRKLSELETLPEGPAAGRLLSFSGDQDAQAVLAEGFNEIVLVVGLHYFSATPAAALEQLVIAAKSHSQSPALLIQSVLNNFLMGYITPQTTAKAELIHAELLALRKEVEAIRKPGPSHEPGAAK